MRDILVYSLLTDNIFFFLCFQESYLENVYLYLPVVFLFQFSDDHLCDNVKCRNHGTCVIKDGSRTCVCNDGYFGSNCGRK